MSCWGSEDGDSWGATGHLTLEEMVAQVTELEKECTGFTMQASEFVDARLSQTWSKDDPHNDEALVSAEPGSPGSSKYTWIWLPNKSWD